MASLLDNQLLEKILDKFTKSREFTISFILHVIMISLFGTAVLFEAIQEPPDFEGESGGFVSGGEQSSAPPQPQQVQTAETAFEVTTPTTVPTQTTSLSAITTTGANELNFEMTSMIMPSVTTAPASTAPPSVVAPAPTGGGGDQMTPEIAAGIAGFAGTWSKGGRGKGAGSGTGLRQREFEFFAYIGQYSGGNWDSTVRVDRRTNTITGGSLPNLLWIINHWSNDRIKTNDKNVQAIKLDSDEIFAIKPPFIFLTGTQDFVLTPKEVETLQRYVRLGGCIWGDSSLPGRNSRFDIAFRREMRRVIPDVDKDFEPLPSNHPIFTDSYFPEIKEVPPGLNFYQEPVYAMEIYGEIGIIYTANDYGNMWQIGLNEQGEVDLRRDVHHAYVAINRHIWDYRHTYLGNIVPRHPTRVARGESPNQAENLIVTYKFGTNIIVHLLTRWDRVIASAPSL